jgi:hypothetical protein
MTKINVRELQKLSSEEMWAMEDKVFTLVFDDGEVQTTTRPTILSHYYWEMQRHFPNATILKRHHIGNGHFTPKLHEEILSHVLFDTYYALNEAVDIMLLSRIAYEITNKIYNDTTTNLAGYVSTVSILDYIEIHNHETTQQIRQEFRPNERAIEAGYEKIKDLLYKREDELADNNVTSMCRANVLSVGQIVQSVAARGFVTDIDSWIPPRPIPTSYTEGMNTLHDSMIESRSGSKASLAQKDPLQMTQYYNRRMQLGCAIIQNLHRVDCGTTRTVRFRVLPQSLKVLVGKYYYDDSNTLKVISGDEKHLIGESIKIRSPLTCEHPDPYGVCSKCMGTVAASVPPDANLGHVAAVELCAVISQSVLSIKHLEVSSVAIEISLDDHHRQYLKLNAKGDKVFIREQKRYDRMELVLNHNDVKHIGDINTIEDITDLSSNRISSCRDVVLNGYKDDVFEDVLLSVSSGKNYSSLSGAMLNYLKEHGWSLNEKGFYVCDLSHWDFNEPAFILPMKHLNMLEYMDVIKTFIESSSSQEDKNASMTSRSTKKPTDDKRNRIVNCDSLSQALMDLHALVSEKLGVNIVHLEIIVLSILARNPDRMDHRLPRPQDQKVFGTYKQNMELRSLTGQAAWMNQALMLISPTSFALTNRPKHPMDMVFMGK